VAKIKLEKNNFIGWIREQFLSKNRFNNFYQQISPPRIMISNKATLFCLLDIRLPFVFDSVSNLFDLSCKTWMELWMVKDGIFPVVGTLLLPFDVVQDTYALNAPHDSWYGRTVESLLKFKVPSLNCNSQCFSRRKTVSSTINQLYFGHKRFMMMCTCIETWLWLIIIKVR
jgi:hypothetical protein